MTTTPDPRPRVAAGSHTIAGSSCPNCEWSTCSTIDHCALCGAALAAAEFGPAGTVWSSTVVRVPVPGRTPPYTVAYVDLDHGPRVLCHVTNDDRPPVGSRVAISGSTDQGDVLVQVAP